MTAFIEPIWVCILKLRHVLMPSYVVKRYHWEMGLFGYGIFGACESREKHTRHMFLGGGSHTAEEFHQTYVSLKHKNVLTI